MFLGEMMEIANCSAFKNVILIMERTVQKVISTNFNLLMYAFFKSLLSKLIFSYINMDYNLNKTF